MNGQWTGTYTGTNSGAITVDMDDCGNHFVGRAYLIEGNKGLPSLGVSFQTPNKARTFAFKTTAIDVYDPANGNAVTWAQVKEKFAANVVIPNYVEVKGSWDESLLKLEWKTNIGSSGGCVLPKSRSDQPSDLNAQKMEWKEFKNHVFSLTGKRHLFRGQAAPWRLRTTFHRNGRADLVRFITEDIPSLYRHLTVRTRHKFDLKDPDENGAFFNLLQHHGYPTPLLDWSYSPYVAAFFAYREISKSGAHKAGPTDVVRVFVLDERWRKELTQIPIATRPFPHLSITEFIAIDNERMIPQQSVSALTNVDDIEPYIDKMGQTIGKGTPYLRAIDLPIPQRKDVFADLRHMGVTAGALFPGLDGTCEEFRERNF